MRPPGTLFVSAWKGWFLLLSKATLIVSTDSRRYLQVISVPHFKISWFLNFSSSGKFQKIFRSMKVCIVCSEAGGSRELYLALLLLIAICNLGLLLIMPGKLSNHAVHLSQWQVLIHQGILHSQNAMYVLLLKSLRNCLSAMCHYHLKEERLPAQHGSNQVEGTEKGYKAWTTCSALMTDMSEHRQVRQTSTKSGSTASCR